LNQFDFVLLVYVRSCETSPGVRTDGAACSPVAGYLNMILATYAVCGVYLLKVARDGVKKHQMLISMNTWALQFTHNVMMCLNMFVVRRRS
jgi:hypothetical protein